MSDQRLPVTLREVARAAGVSTASASRALGAHGAVSADLRRRIVAAAQRLGYTPNLAARSLAAQRSGLIGVLLGSPGEPLLAAALLTLERRLAAAGYGVLVAAAGETPAEGAAALQALSGRGVEGIVLAEAEPPREWAAALQARGLPWIALGDAADAEGALASARRRGAELAGRYLLTLGHRRIGVIASGAETAAGVTGALGGDGLAPLDAGPLSRADPEATAAAMRLLFGRADPPTAVVCSSDLRALAAMRACLGQGAAVPQAVSIIGFGDEAWARYALPALSTVRVPAGGIGTLAAESLLLRLGRGNSPAGDDVAVKLVVRESTGPVPH